MFAQYDYSLYESESIVKVTLSSYIENDMDFGKHPNHTNLASLRLPKSIQFSFTQWLAGSNFFLHGWAQPQTGWAY